jgi:hypothetical protein
MKHPSHITTLGIGLALVLFGGEMTLAWTPPPEPSEASLINEDVNIITGLYTREYSLAQDGIGDYKTARQIIISEYNEYWNSVVETKECPLFYWHNARHNGQWNMYVDRQVEGCSCDIVPYNVQTEDVLADEDPFAKKTRNDARPTPELK